MPLMGSAVVPAPERGAVLPFQLYRPLPLALPAFLVILPAANNAFNMVNCHRRSVGDSLPNHTELVLKVRVLLSPFVST